VRTFFGQERSSDADVRIFWCKKASDFSKFMVCPHRQGEGGGEPVRIFCGQGWRGVNFSRFVRTFFMDGPKLVVWERQKQKTIDNIESWQIWIRNRSLV